LSDHYNLTNTGLIMRLVVFSVCYSKFSVAQDLNFTMIAWSFYEISGVTPKT